MCAKGENPSITLYKLFPVSLVRPRPSSVRENETDDKKELDNEENATDVEPSCNITPTKYCEEA